MRFSKTSKRNRAVKDWTAQYGAKDNLAFFGDALKAFAREGIGNRGVAVIGLLGQADLPGVSLRQAQSVLRWDLRPSLWSHAFLLAAEASGNLANLPLWEVTLHPRSGEFPMPERNGVMEGRLGHYKNPEQEPNAALLTVKMTDREARDVIERASNPNAERLRYNFWDMLGAWQAYLWSHGRRTNPLEEGIPIFSSSYVEMAYEAIGLDLTPGASERNSAPEHLWNATLWWHDAYEKLSHPIAGFFVSRRKECYLADAGSTGLPNHLATRFGRDETPRG